MVSGVIIEHILFGIKSCVFEINNSKGVENLFDYGCFSPNTLENIDWRIQVSTDTL